MHESLKKKQYEALHAQTDVVMDKLVAALAAAEELARLATTSGDEEFRRTFKGELESYLIPSIREFTNSGTQPGSLPSLRSMLDGED